MNMIGFLYADEFDLKHPWGMTIMRVGVPLVLILVLVCWKRVFPAANISMPSTRTWLISLAVVLVLVAVLGTFDWLLLNFTR